MLTVLLYSFVLHFGHCVNVVKFFVFYQLFSFALICASTGSSTIGRSVFVTVIGDSFAAFASKAIGWTYVRQCMC